MNHDEMRSSGQHWVLIWKFALAVLRHDLLVIPRRGAWWEGVIGMQYAETNPRLPTLDLQKESVP